MTTIAWRLGHLIVGIFGVRIANHLNGPPVDYQTFVYAEGADTEPKLPFSVTSTSERITSETIGQDGRSAADQRLISHGRGSAPAPPAS